LLLQSKKRHSQVRQLIVLFSRTASRLAGRSIQNLPHLHMSPPAAISRRYLPSIELAGDRIAACVTGRLDVPNDRAATPIRRTAAAMMIFIFSS
jgi:hypothetical protein